MVDLRGVFRFQKSEFIDESVCIKHFQQELAKIFFYLEPEDRQKIRGVNREWRDVVNTVFGMKIRIKNSTSDLVKSCPYAVEVELNSMTQPFDSSGISFAQSVRKLVLSNIVVTYNLVSFLRACENITHLSFTNIILDQPINDPWSDYVINETNLIPLHSLDTLEIKCFTFVEGVMEILNFLVEKVTFATVKDVIVNVQNPPVIPYQLLLQRNPNPTTVHPLVKLLIKVRPTLNKFMIGRLGMSHLIVI